LKHFQNDFQANDVLGAKFLMLMGEDCISMVKHFINDEHKKIKDFDIMTKLQNIQGAIVGIYDKCDKIHKGTYYL